jgi:anti-sigma factor RsiW
MRCPIETEENLDLLLAYSTGERSAPGMAGLEQHLGGCPACRKFVAGQPAVWAALNSWEPPAVSSDFNRRLYGRIEREIPWWARLFRPLRPLFGWHGLPVAAAACLVITVGIMLQRPSAVPPQPETIQIEVLQPEQVVHALDDLEMLDNFDRAVLADSARPEL